MVAMSFWRGYIVLFNSSGYIVLFNSKWPTSAGTATFTQARPF